MIQKINDDDDAYSKPQTQNCTKKKVSKQQVCSKIKKN